MSGMLHRAHLFNRWDKVFPAAQTSTANDPDGIRTTAVFPEDSAGSLTARQQNRQQTGDSDPSDPELAAVVAAWSDLPPAVRAGIVAMVRAAKP
jgi:hypothetical protein